MRFIITALEKRIYLSFILSSSFTFSIFPKHSWKFLCTNVDKMSIHYLISVCDNSQPYTRSCISTDVQKFNTIFLIMTWPYMHRNAIGNFWPFSLPSLHKFKARFRILTTYSRTYNTLTQLLHKKWAENDNQTFWRQRRRYEISYDSFTQ